MGTTIICQLVHNKATLKRSKFLWLYAWNPVEDQIYASEPYTCIFILNLSWATSPSLQDYTWAYCSFVCIMKMKFHIWLGLNIPVHSMCWISVLGKNLFARNVGAWLISEFLHCFLPESLPCWGDYNFKKDLYFYSIWLIILDLKDSCVPKM